MYLKSKSELISRSGLITFIYNSGHFTDEQETWPTPSIPTPSYAERLVILTLDFTPRKVSPDDIVKYGITPWKNPSSTPTSCEYTTIHFYKLLTSPSATMGAPNRRSIYLASLEAHVDRLHAQLLTLGLYPVPFEKLEPYRGLNSKTAKVSLDSINSVIRGIDRGHKSMVAGLQHDISLTRMKLLELERSVSTFRCPKKKKRLNEKLTFLT